VSQVNQLEKQREENKKRIEKRDLALKLYANREFKKLILDGFCLEDCAQYAQLSQDPALGEREQLDALRISQAAGHLRRFLSVVVQMGNKAEHDNRSIDEVIDEVRLEEAAAEAEALEDQDSDEQGAE
jgi:hypothetical protein